MWRSKIKIEQGDNTMNEERKVWGIHTKDDALFMRDNVIAIG